MGEESADNGKGQEGEGDNVDENDKEVEEGCSVDFGGLFSDYPGWEETSKDESAVQPNDTDGLDWIPEDIEDVAGMEVRSFAQANDGDVDFYESMIVEGNADPLFEMEDCEDDASKDGIEDGV